MPHKWQSKVHIVSEGSEYLVMGYLMCRNVQVRKARPGNKGFDLICVHPQRPTGKQLRIQVKSRSQASNDGSVPLSKRTIDGFDYLVAVFLKIIRNKPAASPEFYTVPQQWVRDHHEQYPSGGGKVFFKKKGMQGEMESFKDDQGFEQIARALRVPSPALY